ncbi:RNA-binding protein [Caulobacter sp. S45]|uniref:RNA-binding protein n=1 Tax=Caulobacter sp. S45 TaxID=1641861 RepID=UPI001576F488
MSDMPPPLPRAHATHAQASRERRDAVSGEVMAEARLVRFVAAPDGRVVPDLARKLPGRGIWIAATRASVEQAVKRNAFARSAKVQLRPPADLADQVAALLRQRLLSALGLARRSGDLTSGFEKTASAVESGRAAWLIEASDGAADGRRKMFQCIGRTDKPPGVVAAFSSDELSLALGLGPVIHLGLLAGQAAQRWTVDVERYAGFDPLLPPGWREGPGEGRSGDTPASVWLSATL